MNKTSIPWCDYTWNPITGCSPESTGCQNCYAKTMAKRFSVTWGTPEFHPDRLDQPAARKHPAKVFVCSMSDFAHEQVKPDWQAQILAAMQRAPWHTYIILTKRPWNLPERFPDGIAIWVGVSVCTGEDLYKIGYINHRKDVAVRFISAEPLLEDLAMSPDCDWLMGLDWVIAGPETGPSKRACKPDWLFRLYSRCSIRGTPFFDKSDSPIKTQFPLAVYCQMLNRKEGRPHPSLR